MGGFHKFFLKNKPFCLRGSFFYKSLVYDIFQNTLMDVLRKMGHNCINKVQLHEILQSFASNGQISFLFPRPGVTGSTVLYKGTQGHRGFVTVI